MSVVTYNLSLSNDLYAKAQALALYNKDGEHTLNDLYQHTSVVQHKFEASKGFSGQEELSTLTKLLTGKRTGSGLDK